MSDHHEDTSKVSNLSKREIRQRITVLKDQLTDQEWKIRSARIRERLINHAVWQQAQHVAVYHSVNKEVDTVPLIEEGWRQGKAIYLPKCNPRTRKLTFYRVDSFHDLEVVYYGIPEPDPKRCAALDFAHLQCLIVPGLAFDKQGYRIGYGGGYYDRLLGVLPADISRVSLAFQFQVLPFPLPRETFDQPVHMIVTEEEQIVCQGEGDHVP
ncbi:5-formyltetrahydrofolate cyclo-ligase [Caldalkalibacillus uzonensis]|uniref:5-formyltetrahydrofolate cyclo-ligase n=1 Tax=Caldalkalibacillus uzonensis TaxID=353224 RepID=A0ABU0CVC0_9BACI|nr:5-formyltetrahydrofolate cyclo-ligase [Caldalkalibacillus uzonensis]MDQ0340374.1 5-formyltetrahydrofolate cyclo-ligase [Caldalkalibacillus uzonensis]